MEKPATHNPMPIAPNGPIPCLDDLPPQLRQEALNVLVAMLLNQRRRREAPHEPRR